MREQFADVIVDITAQKLDRPFSYRIPDHLRGRLKPGMVVEIPFGRGDRILRGYVTAVTDRPGAPPEKMKEIAAVCADARSEEERLVALAAWMKERYGGAMIQALRTVIPVKQKVRRKEEKQIVLAVSGEEAREALAVFEKKHQAARARLLAALLEEPCIPWSVAADKLHVTTAVSSALLDRGLIGLRTETVYRNPGVGEALPQEKTQLNEEQQRAVRTVLERWGREGIGGRYLLYGVTGSGKTEVYMELISRCIEAGRQAIVLIPEISLTYQTVMRLRRRFQGRVSFIHSRLSAGERYDQFERARAGEIDVMVGPRSALFTPFSRLGLIVIDEEHEPAYRSEASPRYQAGETAMERAAMEDACVLFSSATPSLETFHMAETGALSLLRLSNRPAGSLLPEVEIADMRRELQEGNRSIFSRSLMRDMGSALGSGEQVMLFLNRRGYAGAVSCRACGQVIRCPHCDVSLSLHTGGKLVCHYCGYTREAAQICPSCGSRFLRSFRAGTQQVENEVRRLWPSARVLRMDRDTTGRKDDYNRILTSFSLHEADVLIGTQMIVKGHDFPDVTLMGILAADMSLNAPDYRAGERTFQLLTQAAGRAGRRSRRGRVIIQTYDPDHYCIQAAAAGDYEAFYEQEMDYRRAAGSPPAGTLVAVHMTGPDLPYLETAASYLGEFARRAAGRLNVRVLGPADEAVAKIQDVYRKVLYLKGESGESVRRVRACLEQYVEINSGFDSIGISYE